VAVAVLAASLIAHDAMAQARNPFSVGISEGGGGATGFAGWILAKQAEFERLLSGAVRAVKTDRAALSALMGLSFVYGVFHAAGPGHGKAVVASYMLANERALRRGLAISFLAAILQGLVATALVGILALVLHATAQRMRDTASLIETASYLGIMALGVWLMWTKGRGLVIALRAALTRTGDAPAAAGPAAHLAQARALVATIRAPAFTVGANHIHDEACGHLHAPDPRLLGEGFSWSSAIGTVIAAGIRPCSGAILVLVFAFAQGIFYAGVGATLAMSVGTAITTGALAATAVFAKTIALRLVGGSGSGAALIGRGFEFAAACFVFLVGLSLLLGSSIGGA
jgi:ABC-type nickel/cobalt efflux system permease component RcnA